jgi:hypothetical protein
VGCLYAGGPAHGDCLSRPLNDSDPSSLVHSYWHGQLDLAGAASAYKSLNGSPAHSRVSLMWIAAYLNAVASYVTGGGPGYVKLHRETRR